jgi:hypothetical protein
VSNLPAAIENAAAFSEEVVRRLRQGGKQEAGAL